NWSSVTTIGVSAMGSLKAAAEGPLRSKPVVNNLAAMSWGVSSAMADLLRLPVSAAKLRAGISVGPVVARRRAGVDRRATWFGEFQVPAGCAHHTPAFALRKLDQRTQPLTAASQFTRARHGRPLPHRAGR